VDAGRIVFDGVDVHGYGGPDVRYVKPGTTEAEMGFPNGTIL